MAFKFDDLKKQINLDNPTYERHIKSDLHTLVAILSKVPKAWTAQSIAVEMKKVKSTKWIKYARTRRYLEKEIIGLKALLLAIPTKFKTMKMVSELDDTILRHTFKWESDTGSMQDLQRTYTRENVKWGQWPKTLTDCIGLPHGKAYLTPGHHTGLASANPASTGQGSDGHALMAVFNQTILNYAGPPAQAKMDQVYEYSHDRINWFSIPESAYTIVREVKDLGNNKVQLTITKTNKTKPSDKFTVKKIF
jgi:hypothetical protein